MTIRILVTGGTFDKTYDELAGRLDFRDSHLPEMLRLGRCRVPVKVRTVMMIDSLEMTEGDRELLAASCRQAPEERIVITHGTDTMVETAAVLARGVAGKTIVLTGAMIPWTFNASDGLFNLGSALSFVQVLPPGVYIAMNGRCFAWDNVRKNRQLGVFEPLREEPDAPRPPERAGGPVAPKAPPGHQRLARLLQARHPGLPFTRAKEAVAAGQVLVDGAVATDPGAWVAGSAAVDWDPNRPRHRQERIEVVHLDADLVVVAKPAGLLTIPTTDGEERDTLLSRVVRELRRRGERPHVEVVHRLDRETSGLLVFARGRDALHALQAQLLDRSMGRVYTALVEGEVRNAAGTFDRALVGDGVRHRRWVAGPGQVGKASVTHWRVTERFAGATRVEARLETGRTHQIRIHFAAAGHPLLGDAVYRPAGAPPFPLPVPRVALHAGELYLVHPRDGRRERFRLPLPADLEELLERLRAVTPKA